MQFFSNANVNFVGRMKGAFILSAVLLLVGIGSLIVKGGPALSIDFTGGTILQVRIHPAPTVAEVRGAIERDIAFAGVQVQDFGAADEFLITFRNISEGNIGEGDADPAGQMKARLVESFSASQVELRRQESVGPKIGAEIQTAAMNSVFAALVLIVLYITVRFVFRYGIAAILALVHDVMITLGIFSLLNMEISLSIIAAFMTIIGYSLNDTIVVFDRIRENMRLRRRESYREVINRSINECLSRTILTSLTTFFVAGTLWLLGGPVIHDFAFALSFGVIVGTYSSVFIASPILVWWYEWRITDKKRTKPSL